MSAQPIDRRIAREAARWFVRLQGNASEAERDACARWRASHADHERAWRLAERFHAHLREIPTEVGVPVLDRAQGIDRRDTLKLLALLIAAAPLGALGYRELPWRAWSAGERTAVGERRELTLADGTRVLLNTDSALDVVFDDDLRLLRLRAGEILVTSAQDRAGRPLLVETAEGRVRPVGTRFSVRQFEDETQVAVFEGAVQLQPRHGAQLFLPAGQQAFFAADGVDTPVPLAAHAGDWTRGVLRAEKMRLADFATELARYRPGLLRCDPAVAGLLISGAFQLHDTDEALAALARTLPVEIHYRSRYWVTLAPRST